MSTNQPIMYPTRRIGPQHVRRLRAMHAELAHDFAAAVSTLVRSPVSVSLTGVEQLTYGQFVYNLETPACFHVLKADPLFERLMLDIEPAILYPMIDRMLGGGRDEEPPPNRPLSDIELCVAARIVRRFLQECSHAWQDIADLKLDVLRVDSDPRLLRTLPAEDLVVLTSFEITLGQQRGLARFCIPTRAIEQLGDKLMPNDAACDNQSVSDSIAELRVMLATTQITAAELADLRIGDIIATETETATPATVTIDGEPCFQAKPGAYQGRKAVCLAAPIAPEPPPVSEPSLASGPPDGE